MNQAAAKIHVVPSQLRGRNRRMVAGRLARTYRCDRCGRNLPDDQFGEVDFNLKLSILYLHPVCRLCRTQSKSRWSKHPLYTPALHRHCSRLLVGAKQARNRRKTIVLGIDVDDVMRLFIEQQGACALSRVQMTVKGGTSVGPKVWTSASIDRIDSAGNYTLDNVHLVCWAVNAMKSDMTVDQFQFWCAAVAIRTARSVAA